MNDGNSGPDRPLFTAADLLAQRRKMGTYPRFPPPEAVIFCHQRAVVEGIKRKHRLQAGGGFYAELYLLRETGGRVALATHFGPGAPAAVALLEDLAAFGARRFISLGMAGGLQSELQAGDLVLCSQAIRDEGTSRHYLEPSRYAHAAEGITRLLEERLEALGKPYRTGACWTTDAPYREMRSQASAYQQEGVLAVDMECAALFAAGQALHVPVGAAFSIGDSLSQLTWKLDFDLKKTLQGLETLAEAAIAVLQERT